MTASLWQSRWPAAESWQTFLSSVWVILRTEECGKQTPCISSTWENYLQIKATVNKTCIHQTKQLWEIVVYRQEDCMEFLTLGHYLSWFITTRFSLDISSISVYLFVTAVRDVSPRNAIMYKYLGVMPGQFIMYHRLSCDICNTP